MRAWCGAIAIAVGCVSPAMPVLRAPRVVSSKAGCADATTRAERFFAEGRLDRAARTLASTRAQCPHETRALSMRVLDELGRDAEAKAIAASASEADDESTRRLARALMAKVPSAVSGPSLLATALAAKAAGEIVRARRLFDRAAVALAGDGGERSVDSRNGFSGPARVVRWTPQGSLVVAHGASISVFSALRESQVLRGHRANVGALAISLDGKTLASAAGDRTLRLWDLSSGASLRSVVLTADPTSLAFSKSGDLAIGLANRTVHVVRDGAPDTVLSGHTGAVTAVAYAPDGTLVSASIDRTVRFHDATGKVIGTATTPLSIAFSPNGKLLAVGGADPSVRVYDATSGWAVATLTGHAEAVLDLAFSPDGGTLATSSADETVRLWSAGAGFVCRKTLEGHVASVGGVAFDPSGAYVASASEDRTVQIWDAHAGAATATLGAHAEGATAVALSSKGSIAWGSRDGAVRILREVEGPCSVEEKTARSCATLSTVRGHVTAVLSLAWSNDTSRIGEGTLASGGDDDAVRIVRAAEERDLSSTKLGSHKGSVAALAWSPDGLTLASGARDGTLRTWAPPNPVGESTRKHGKAIESIAWSPDGAHVLSGSVDGTIRVWTGTTSQQIRHSGTPILALAFRDASSFASGSFDGSIALFSLDGTRQALLEGHADGVTSLAWSRGLLASTSLDGTALLWTSLGGGAPLPLDQEGDDEVTSVAFTRDGSHLATAAGDGAIRLFRRDGKLVIAVRGLREGGGYLFTPSGHYESLGESPPPLRCAIGANLYPIELCEERFAVRGLLRKALAGEVGEEP